MITKEGDNIRLRRNASSSRVFMFRDGQFNAPAGFDATLVKNGTGKDEEYVISYNDSGSVYIYYGFDAGIPELRRGKLKEKTNKYYHEAKLVGERYSYDEAGFVVSVTTAQPQTYRIQYSYSKTEHGIQRLTKIEVFAKDTKIAEAEYQYYEFLETANEDLGSFGDLVQAKISTLLSDGKSWQTKTLQYRYHRTANEGGFDHQIKQVYEADAIERILYTNTNLRSADDLLAKKDGEISPFVSRSFSYNKTEIDTNKEVQTPWGMENLAQKYGGGDFNRVTPIGRVQTEAVNSDCASCGGGSAGGISRTYHYLNVNEVPAARYRGHDNVVVHVVIEDTRDSEGFPRKRTIYGLQNRGAQLRKIDIENPLAEKLNVVAVSTIRNAAGLPVEERSQAVHSLVDSNEKVAQFLNTYRENGANSDNDIARMRKDKGIVTIYEYNDSKPPKQISELKKIGSEGTAYFVTATDYNKNGDIVAEHVYRTATTERNAKDRTTTRYEYSFWDRDQKVLKTKKTSGAAIPKTENGTGKPSISQVYYDSHGNPRWTIDAAGVVNYNGYDSISGKQTVSVRDVDTTKLPEIVATDWTDEVPFQRAENLPAALNQTSQNEYDVQGRLVCTRDHADRTNYTVYSDRRILRFSAWDAETQKPILPISVTELSVADKPTSVYELPPTSVIVQKNKPVGVAQNAEKLSWTRYDYDLMDGHLKAVNRYHTIPKSDEGALGEHFYRTEYLSDTLGRQAAVSKMAQVGKWQVEATEYDWQGRPVEQMRGVAMNPPQLADLEEGAWLATLAKMEYDGHLLSRHLFFFDKDSDSFTGVQYHYDAWDRLRSRSSFDNAGKTFGPFRGPFKTSLT